MTTRFNAQNVSWCRLMRIFTFWDMDIIRMDHYPHLRCAIMLRDLSCFSTAAVPRRLMFLWQLQISAIIKCDWSLRFIDCDFFSSAGDFWALPSHDKKLVFVTGQNFWLIPMHLWLSTLDYFLVLMGISWCGFALSIQIISTQF